MRSFVADLDWRGNPWRESHRGAGLFAALVIAEEVDLAWQDAYFDWLWENTDAQTGLLGGTDLPRITHSGTTTMVPHMAGTFHYLFNMQWARRPSRYPERLIDACLAMYEERQFPLGQRIGFAEIDWFYCMNRSLRQCNHRFEESRAAIEQLGRELSAYVLSLDPATGRWPERPAPPVRQSLRLRRAAAGNSWARGNRTAPQARARSPSFHLSGARSMPTSTAVFDLRAVRSAVMAAFSRICKIAMGLSDAIAWRAASGLISTVPSTLRSSGSSWARISERHSRKRRGSPGSDHINSFARRRYDQEADGSYEDTYGHSLLHANGMVIGALGPLGGRQAQPVRLYEEFDTPEKVRAWLDGLDWSNQWRASHLFWGGLHCFSFSRACNSDWREAVFDWLDGALDEVHRMVAARCPACRPAPATRGERPHRADV